jgi:hypothetical protein
MADIKIKRNFEFIGALINYDVYLNGVLEKKISNGKELKLELGENKVENVEIFIKFNKFRSKLTSLTCNKNEQIVLKVFTPIYINIFFILTFGFSFFLILSDYDIEPFIFMLIPIPLASVILFYYVFKSDNFIKIKLL